jgi:hypothetical protein
VWLRFKSYCYVKVRSSCDPLMNIERNMFYVTDGNIMYLTDASRFRISCVIQHYAPVVGWGRVEEQMHNVDYHPGP